MMSTVWLCRELITLVDTYLINFSIFNTGCNLTFWTFLVDNKQHYTFKKLNIVVLIINLLNLFLL